MSTYRTASTLKVLAAGLLACAALAGCQSTGQRDGLAWKSPFTRSAKQSSTDNDEAWGRSGGKGLVAGTTGRSYMLDLAQGRNLEKAGEWDKARDVYRQLKDQYPDRSEPYHRLGVVADRQRRHEEAQRLYTQALQRSPRSAELFNDLGYCFYLQGQLEKAESALRKAVYLEDDNPRYHNNLGMVLGHQQRYQEALREFAAAGSEADGYYNLAFVYASQEKHDEATACFRQALRLNPTHEQAREALASFQQYDDRQPSEDVLVDLDESPGNVAYVPFVENSLSDGGPVGIATSATSGVSAGEGTTSGGRAGANSGTVSAQRQASHAARSMHTRSEGMLRRNMSSQRQDELSGDDSR